MSITTSIYVYSHNFISIYSYETHIFFNSSISTVCVWYTIFFVVCSCSYGFVSIDDDDDDFYFLVVIVGNLMILVVIKS